MSQPRPQSGFAYIAAIVFLVVVAGIAVALLQLTNTQQTTVNQALLGARAGLAARGGIEWVYQDLGSRCTQPGTITDLGDFVNDTGFRVRVTCSYRIFREGEHAGANGEPEATVKHIYTIQSVACNRNGPGACPDDVSVPRADYVERKRIATVCMTANNQFCY
ncbi:MSHA biogenesis protein MshP [Massilia oculi]|uniref:MSHA biogenesis protein MshP n=1 Tax=Massilia oculi TaxID=945844 RepID=UPI001AAE58CD|nr:MSHA biogenesis protein MshP [Massilia oculi]